VKPYPIGPISCVLLWAWTTTVPVLAGASDVVGGKKAALCEARSRAAQSLVAMQRTDGGFGYRPGGMGFSDVTAWALVALAKTHPNTWPSGRSFLMSCRSGKAFGAFSGSSEPSWMTAPVALAFLQRDNRDSVGLAALRWLLDEDQALRSPGSEAPGWPWTPGCAPWVEPTAISSFCLGALGFGNGQRVVEALSMIQRNQSRGGGWSLYETRAYPYHTGLVILAHLACGWDQADAGSRFDLEPARRYLLRSLSRSSSRLDLSMGGWALAGLDDPAASEVLEWLVARASPEGTFGDTLETSFGLLGLTRLLDEHALPERRRRK